MSGYGAANRESVQNGTSHTVDEESPLLGKETSTLRKRLQRHMNANINKSWADLILLSCYIITGLLDSSAVYIWGSFVSMQTGNTVYLGLGLVEPDSSNRWLKSLISIGFFCLGSLCFSSFHRFFSPRRRWVLFASFGTQVLLIIIAAVMVTIGAVHGKGLEWHVIIPLALLAFQSSGQAVTSRVLQFNGLPSVVLTSTYCDLFSDPKLFIAGIKEDPERNRRIAAPLLLLAGAVSGGVFAHSEVGLAGALWTAAGLKFVVVLAWLFWAAEPEESDE